MCKELSLRNHIQRTKVMKSLLNSVHITLDIWGLVVYNVPRIGCKSFLILCNYME